MERSEETIHQIYEAANNPEYWMSAAQSIVSLERAGAVHLFLTSIETGHEYVNLFTRDGSGFAAEYIHDYAADDFRVPRVMRRQLGVFSDEREYVSADEAKSSAVHQELLPRHEVYKISGANLCLDGCIGWFGISTPNESAEFDDRQRGYLKRLSRHMLTACRIARTHQDLKLFKDHSLGSLDLLTASFFMMQSGRIVHMNDAANRLIKNSFFAIRNEKLVCLDGARQEKLSSFLKRESRLATDRPLILRHEEEDAAYAISVHDLFPQYDGDRLNKSDFQAISIVELNIPARIPFEEVLAFCSGYGATRAEAMAVHASLNSVSLTSFAEARNIRLDTARQQLKSALAKMELDSQKRLFRAFERYRTFNGKRR